MYHEGNIYIMEVLYIMKELYSDAWHEVERIFSWEANNGRRCRRFYIHSKGQQTQRGFLCSKGAKKYVLLVPHRILSTGLRSGPFRPRHHEGKTTNAVTKR